MPQPEKGYVVRQPKRTAGISALAGTLFLEKGQVQPIGGLGRHGIWIVENDGPASRNDAVIGALIQSGAAEYAVAVKGNTIIYEIGVPQFDYFGGFTGGQTVVSQMKTYKVVGFDIVASSRWGQAGFGMVPENLLTGKSDDADKFAQYTLVSQLSLAAPVHWPPIWTETALLA